VVASGDVVVDATCGNGNDTEILASIVGETGTLHAVDIQEEAICKTAAKLKQLSLSGVALPSVQMHCRSHAELTDLVQPSSAMLVVFNLGYLPGGDRTIVTSADSSVAAIQAALGVRILCLPGMSHNSVTLSRVALKLCGLCVSSGSRPMRFCMYYMYYMVNCTKHRASSNPWQKRKLLVAQ
jgi:hypothetical protein